MRVIAGTAKGRKLVAPKGLETRPTSDRVKESLFSIIGERVPGARVLDLYAGTGALAIEALSRGALEATLIENGRQALNAIERNLETTGFGDQSVTMRISVRAALSRLSGDAEVFDLIFIDPPYRIEPVKLDAVLSLAVDCLSERGLGILEHPTRLRRLALDERMVIIDSRRYGDTSISLFEKRNN